MLANVAKKLLVAVALGGVATSTQAQVVEPGAIGPATFDVAGVRLGATPQQVRDALAHVGYKVIRTNDALSFDQEARLEAARRLGRSMPLPKIAGTSSIVAAGPHGEYAEVTFMQTKAGSQVGSVHVRLSEEAMTADAFRRQVEGKYGRPGAVKDQGLSSYWCSAEVAKICGLSYAGGGKLANTRPMLMASTVGGRSLTLSAGDDTDRRIRREKEEAILELAPKTDKAAF